jgi:hypothetical protein
LQSEEADHHDHNDSFISDASKIMPDSSVDLIYVTACNKLNVMMNRYTPSKDQREWAGFNLPFLLKAWSDRNIDSSTHPARFLQAARSYLRMPVHTTYEDVLRNLDDALEQEPTSQLQGQVLAEGSQSDESDYEKWIKITARWKEDTGFQW